MPGAPTGPFRPNLADYSQHEYGNRVGVFRILRILDKYGIKPTMAMDKTVAEKYPFLVNECKKRKLEVMAHGTTARRPIHAGMTPDIERAYIKDSIGAVAKAMGKAPAGWLGPDFAESMNTPNLLAAEGIRYVCDWSNDEQPYKMKVPQGELYSVGVDYDLDDIFIHWTGRRSHRRVPPDHGRQLRRAVSRWREERPADGGQRAPVGDGLAVAEQVPRSRPRAYQQAPERVEGERVRSGRLVQGQRQRLAYPSVRRER